MSNDGYVTETREVSDFDRVTLKEFGKLIVTQGDEEALTVETHPDLLNKITTEVRNRELILGIKGDFLDRFTDFISTSFSGHRITFYLTVKSLHALKVTGAGTVDQQQLQTDQMKYWLTGAGSINAQDLSAQSVEVHLSGTGKIGLSGSTTDQEVLISGAGAYMAKNLESRNAKVTLSGAGKGVIWARDHLDVHISGLGSVDYYGEPEKHLNITGLGNVVGLGDATPS